LIEDYFARIEHSINDCPFVVHYECTKDKRSLHLGIIEGRVTFIDDSGLHFMEFIDVSKGIEKFKYSYHYETRSNSLVFRYDMAPHFKGVATFPHHKHEGNAVKESMAPSLRHVLSEIEEIIQSCQ
jgi:hypothetical protein